jgi:hypothetical protein
MAENRESPDDNPFRAYSPRNVLARARERIELVRHWLIRHDGPASEGRPPAETPPGPDGKSTPDSQ